MTLPTTAAGWAELSVRTGREARDETWKDGKLAPPEVHANLAYVVVSSVTEAMLWEALRLANPAAADKLAEDVELLCDTGDTFGELLHEWEERLAAGQPLSGSAEYEDVWQRVGLTSSNGKP